MNGDPDGADAASDNLRVDLTSRSALIAYAVVGIALLFALGAPVPFNNEHIYLTGPYRLFHPDFARTQWTFTDPQYGHLPFEVMAGTLMAVLPLEIVGWLLRFVAGAGMVIGIVKVGAVMGVRPWMTAVAIVVWVANDQAILAGEFILGTAEAKAFALSIAVLRNP